jgi:uncharacterized protein (DUF427 family)
VSLTTGRGPFSPQPAGRFKGRIDGRAGPHDQVVYVEPFLRRVRGIKGRRLVVDSEQVLLVHRSGSSPIYAFPASDVSLSTAKSVPDVPGHVQVGWDDIDEWYEEEDRVFGHPRNPYHRVDCVRTKRRLSVRVEGVSIVDTTGTTGVYETALAPRLYVARAHVRADLLSISATQTYCPYKGTASYWTAVVGDTVVEDIAWSYESPLPECLPICGLLSFDEARAEVLQELPTV